jgi:hypothetical protein
MKLLWLAVVMDAAVMVAFANSEPTSPQTPPAINAERKTTPEEDWAIDYIASHADDTTLETDLATLGAPSGTWHDQEVKLINAMRSAVNSG